MLSRRQPSCVPTRTTTIGTTAVAMKADRDYGTVTEGKYADIIAVKGDVLKQVALLQRVDIVVKHGRRIK